MQCFESISFELVAVPAMAKCAGYADAHCDHKSSERGWLLSRAGNEAQAPPQEHANASLSISLAPDSEDSVPEPQLTIVSHVRASISKQCIISFPLTENVH